MRKIIILVFAIIMVLIKGSVCAQDITRAKNWTISDCIKYATDHNIQINTLRLDKQLSEQDLRVAWGSKTPSLSATLTNSFKNANNTASANSGLVNQLTTSGTYSLNSSVVLWNADYINNNIRQRELSVQSAGLSVQQSVNNINLLITQDYLNILLAKENLKYIVDLVSASEEKLKQGQMFFTAGSIAKKDLLQLQAQLASDKYLLVQTENTIRQNILSLRQTLQLPGDTLFDIITPGSINVEQSLIPLYEVQQSALRDFPEMKLGKLAKDMALLDIDKAKAGFKPELSANGSIGTGYSDVITNSFNSKTAYFAQTGNNFYQQAGLSLSIPIFSNHINKSNLAKANIAYAMAVLDFDNFKLVLSQAVEQAYLNARNSIQSFEAAREQLDAASESYRISNEQFKLGSINTYDLLQQRNQYVQAVQAFTQAKYTAVLQQKIYEFYMGRPVTL